MATNWANSNTRLIRRHHTGSFLDHMLSRDLTCEAVVYLKPLEFIEVNRQTSW